MILNEVRIYSSCTYPFVPSNVFPPLSKLANWAGIYQFFMLAWRYLTSEKSKAWIIMNHHPKCNILNVQCLEIFWTNKISVLKNSESARERARARRTFQNFQLRERAASSSSKFRGEWASNESARRSLARGSLAIFLPNPKMPHFGQKRVAEGGCWVDL